MNKEQLDERIEIVCKEFSGQLPDLCQIVGVVVVGRLFGWRVVRLAVSRRVWSMTIKAFGDPKKLMPERGLLAYKSVGLKITDELGEYWSLISGSKPRDGLSVRERKMIT